MDADHWRLAKDREVAPPRSPNQTPKEKLVMPPPGPRLHMFGYTYPQEFDVGRYERVRQLNSLLLSYYRKIGKEVDEMSQAKEVYEFFTCTDHLGDYNYRRLETAKKKLLKSLGQVVVLIAELDAIGASYHIPDQLKKKIKVKQYVRPGSLAYLPGVNFYHSEIMEDVPNVPANQKRLLKRISFFVNRVIFLQECGQDFREGRVYAGYYKFLKADYKKLQDYNFQMNLQPALINRVRQILGQEPEVVRAEREKEEEKQRRKKEEEKRRKEEERKNREWRRMYGCFPPSPSPPPSSSEEGAVEEVPGVVEEGEVQGDVEEGEIQGDVAEGEVQGAVEEGEFQGVVVEDDFQFPEVWEGQHTYFHYSSDEE